ncbi:hypothetical protein CPB86DRAFT_867295 [Serendipita vermifera]|nr:hypothetical protein CPB86DRAFT_867295 [Serendipita vermifera]
MVNAVVAKLEDALYQITVSRYLCGAALVLSIYDWLLLLGDEYLTIWKARWTLPKAIYYFNRIVTPAGLAVASYRNSPEVSDLSTLHSKPLSSRVICSCRVYTFANSLVELLSFFLSNWLLTLRLVALYKRKRWLVWFLYGFLIASYAVTAFLMVWTLRAFGMTIHYSKILHACGSTTRSPLMPAIFLAPAAYECTLFFLLGYSAWKDAKIMYGPNSAPFLYVLYRDGAICFFIMFGVRIWNVWIYATQPLTSAYLGIYLLWATMTILSTRVYHNLMFLVQKPALDATTQVSRAQFASPIQMGGIKMRVQTETFTDPTVTTGIGTGTNGRTFDSVSLGSIYSGPY